MSTKAQLQTRIDELERAQANCVAAIDELCTIKSFRGIRILATYDSGPVWSILVIDNETNTPETAAVIAGVFTESLQIVADILKPKPEV